MFRPCLSPVSGEQLAYPTGNPAPADPATPPDWSQQPAADGFPSPAPAASPKLAVPPRPPPMPVGGYPSQQRVSPPPPKASAGHMEYEAQAERRRAASVEASERRRRIDESQCEPSDFSRQSEHGLVPRQWRSNPEREQMIRRSSQGWAPAEDVSEDERLAGDVVKEESDSSGREQPPRNTSRRRRHSKGSGRHSSGSARGSNQFQQHRRNDRSASRGRKRAYR